MESAATVPPDSPRRASKQVKSVKIDIWLIARLEEDKEAHGGTGQV